MSCQMLKRTFDIPFIKYRHEEELLALWNKPLLVCALLLVVFHRAGPVE